MRSLKTAVFTFGLTAMLILGYATAGKAEVIRLIVKEEQAGCTGVAPMTCMQVKYKNSKSWELFYGSITGFNYQPGFRYVLLVNRTKITRVPADAPAYAYKLKKIVQKKRMPVNKGAWNFVLKHKWKLIQIEGVTQTESPVYMVFDSTKMRVGGKSGCNGFFGGYKENSGTLYFAQMAGTQMLCGEEQNKLEHQFLNLLGDKTFRYDVADQTLNLYQNDKLVLMFGMAPL